MGDSCRAAARLYRIQLRGLVESRAFSTSARSQRKGELASFPTTSSPELDEIINTFRSNVFIPNHVNRAYRAMIYKPSLQYYLTGEEPVKAKIRVKPTGSDAPLPSEQESDQPPAQDRSKIPQATAPPAYPQKKPQAPVENMLLNPLDRNVDEPRTRSQYLRMLSLMETPEDFALVPEFLRELRAADRPVTASMLAKTVRRGSELNSIDTVMQMFSGIDRMGVPIKHRYVLTEVLLAAVDRAVKGTWSTKVLDAALRQADAALTMIADPRHNESWPAPEQRVSDPNQASQLWGTAMALEAIRALKYEKRNFGFDDERGLESRVAAFVNRYPSSPPEIESPKWNAHNEFLAHWAPAYVGSKYAMQALDAGSDLSRKLQAVLSTLEPAILRSTQIVKENPPEQGYRRGLKLLNDMEEALEVMPPAEEADVAGFDSPETTEDPFEAAEPGDEKQPEPNQHKHVS